MIHKSNIKILINPALLLFPVCDEVSSGGVVFLSLLSCQSYNLVASTLSELQVPLISLGSPCGVYQLPRTHVWEYPVREPSLGGPLPDIISSMGWQDVLVIHEDQDGESYEGY